jgi:hypothetical protein
MDGKRQGALLILNASVLLFTATVLKADIVTIPLPTSAYTSSTTLLPDGPENTPVPSITDGNFTASISGAVAIPRAPVPNGWQTWGAPPNTETATPAVIEFQTPLTCTTCAVSLLFSMPVGTFGFEAEPDPFVGPQSLMVTFLDGANVAGTITQQFDSGLSSASLIAASTFGEFTGLTIYSDTDFALANLRYGPLVPTPEPDSWALLATGSLAVFGGVVLRRRRIAA